MRGICVDCLKWEHECICDEYDDEHGDDDEH